MRRRIPWFVAVPIIVLAAVAGGSVAGLTTHGRATAEPAPPAEAARAAVDPRAGHPALQAFDLAGQTLPAALFLVRTRGELPAGAEAAGVVVHGRHRGVFLVSGDSATVLDLAARGCAVVPVRGAAKPPRIAPRQWAPLDTPDPAIAALVAQVGWTGISSRIQRLVNLGTRYSYAANHHAVADTISGMFASYGLTPVQRSFTYAGRTLYNVEATQAGTVYPDSLIIICGHFDSYSQTPSTNAPGADDNASGTAAVLTAAAICSPHDFKYSIRYICFAAEEQGLIGSEVYAAWAEQNDLAIVGVLNFDMVAWWISGVPRDLEIETNVASQWLAAAITDCADLYTDASWELHVDDGAWWGDHFSFWEHGYAAVNHEEAWDWGDPDLSPYYHTTSDLPATLDPGFAVDNIQVAVAALATLAVPDAGSTGVDDRPPGPSPALSISARPNPFRDRVAFAVAGLAGRDRARILIYDAGGRRVAAVPVALHGGQGTAVWDVGAGAEGLASGVYFARLAGFPGAPPAKIICRK